MLSIFQSEVVTLESQVAALQAQITAAQERIAALGEAEKSSEAALAVLQNAVEKVSALAPSAIANLKTAVFNLFNVDSGNQDQMVAPAPELNGEASELCCLLSDCPAESLQGQAVELACLIGHPELCEGQLLEAPAGLRHEGEDDRELPTHMVPVEEPAYIDLVRVSDCVAYMRRLDGEVIAVYAGGSNKGKLKNWGDWLTRTNSVTNGYELRESKRLDTKWEIKLTSMTLKQIDRLAACDFNKDPRNCYPDAPKRQLERVPSTVEIEDIGVGDTVRSVTVKHWQYKVVKINPDGFYVCERIGTNPVITQTLHLGSIELVAKADVINAAASDYQEALDSIQPPFEPKLSYSLIESSNLDQVWGVSQTTPDGKHKYLGSVSCGTDKQRWSHGRQPKYGQGIPHYQSKELAGAALAKAYATFDSEF
jgi:hypothetical protein